MISFLISLRNKYFIGTFSRWCQGFCHFYSLKDVHSFFATLYSFFNLGCNHPKLFACTFSIITGPNKRGQWNPGRVTKVNGSTSRRRFFIKWLCSLSFVRKFRWPRGNSHIPYPVYGINLIRWFSKLPVWWGIWTRFLEGTGCFCRALKLWQ